MEETTYVAHVACEHDDEVSAAAERARLIGQHGFQGASFVLHPHRLVA